MAIKFYYSLESPPSRIVWMLLKQLNIDCEENVIDFMKQEQKTEEYAKINPLMQVPVIIDGDLTVSESRSIAMYLCKTYESADKKEKMYPEGVKEQAKFHERMMRDVDNYIMTRRYLNAEAILEGRASDLDHGLLPRIEQILREYDGILTKNEYIFGSHLTFLDLTYIQTISVIYMSGYSGMDNYPNIKRWEKTLAKLPYYEECIKTPITIGIRLFEMIMKMGAGVIKK